MTYSELVIACRGIEIQPTACDMLLGGLIMLVIMSVGFAIGFIVARERCGC